MTTEKIAILLLYLRRLGLAHFIYTDHRCSAASSQGKGISPKISIRREESEHQSLWEIFRPHSNCRENLANTEYLSMF